MGSSSTWPDYRGTMVVSRETNGERLIQDSAFALLPAFRFWLVVIASIHSFFNNYCLSITVCLVCGLSYKTE